jgi:AcrR family transcriptional regulator
MNNKPTSSDQTREAFIEAFCLLQIEKPFEKITVQDLARKAGYHRSTFYQYFSDINDLLSTIEEEMLAEVMEKNPCRKVIDSSFIEEMVKRFDERELYIKALMGEFSNNHFLDRIKTIAAQEINELSLLQDQKLNPYLIEYHLSGIFSLFRLWLSRDQDLSTEEFLSFGMGLYNKVVFSATKEG